MIEVERATEHNEGHVSCRWRPARSIVDGWVAEDDEKTFDLSSHKCHCRMGVYLPITSSSSGSFSSSNAACHEGCPCEPAVSLGAIGRNTVGC